MKRLLVVLLTLSMLLVGISVAEEDLDEWYTVNTDRFANFAGVPASKFILTDDMNLSGVALAIASSLEEVLPELYTWDFSLGENVAVFVAYDTKATDNALQFFIYNKLDELYWWTYLNFENGSLEVNPYYNFQGEDLVDMYTADNGLQMRYMTGTTVIEAYTELLKISGH